jgi:hypothetical protein
MWDKGIDYEYIKNKLEKTLKNPKNEKNYAYTATLYTQLLNGTRISEAVRAIQEFAKTGKRELNIKLSKKKKQETRLIIIPENIDRQKCMLIGDEDEKKLTERIKTYAKYKYKINTSSLRYAFITPPQTKREPIAYSKNHTPLKTRLYTYIHARKRSGENTQTKHRRVSYSTTSFLETIFNAVFRCSRV